MAALEPIDPPWVAAVLRVHVHLGEDRQFTRLAMQARALTAPPLSDARMGALMDLYVFDCESSVISCRRCVDAYPTWHPRHWTHVLGLKRAYIDLHRAEREQAARIAGEE